MRQGARQGVRQGARQGVRQGVRQGQDKERDRGETSETSHLVKLSLPDISLVVVCQNESISSILTNITLGLRKDFDVL